MIVATHMGMYMPSLRPNHAKLLEGEPELQIRSRRKVDLLNLREFAQVHDLEIGEPFQMKNTDYQFRSYATRQTWGLILAELALDIDYTKFKHTPEQYHGDKKLSSCYERMWGVILDAFPTGSIYSRAWRPAKQSKGVKQGVITEHITYTKVSDLIPRQRDLWEMSQADRFARKDQEPEVWDDDNEVKFTLNDDLSWDVKGPGPVETKSNQLDHSHCDHASSKSARRRCRKEYWS